MEVSTDINPFHQVIKLRRELAELHTEIERLHNGIRETLEKNRHLADGDDCTLIELKRLIKWED